MSANVVTEAPLYVEYAVKSDVFQNFGLNKARERRPQPPTSIWYETANIPDTPPITGAGHAYVTKVDDLALTQVSGNTNRYENAAFINMVPSTASATSDTAYRPVLKDSTGTEVPWDVGVWVADSFLNVVEFKSGVPSAYTAPFTLTFWRYDGVQLVTNGTFQATSGVIAPTGIGATLASDDFVVGSDQLDDAGDATKDARMLFDKSKGAVRGGTATGDEWDDAKRGAGSAAFGSDTEAQGDYSFSAGSDNDANGDNSAVVGGYQNSISAGGARSGILAGWSNTISSSVGMQAIVGGYDHTISATANHNGIMGGLSATVSGGARNSVIVGGSSLTISDGHDSALVGGDTNSITSSNHQNAIVGGITNSIAANGPNNVIVGGNTNAITAADAAFGNCAVVAGRNNTINSGTLASNSAIVASITSTMVTDAGSHNAIIAAETGTISAGSGNVVVGHNNTVTAGSQSFAGGVDSSIGHSRSFVWNGAGVTGTGPLATSQANSFLVRAAGEVGGANHAIAFYTGTSGIATGSYMNRDDAGWTNICLKSAKDLQEETAGTDVLDRVMRVPIYTYNYKGQDPEKRYIGPCADDWHTVFPSSKDQNGIMARDVAGVSLGAIQGLGRLMEGVQKENAALREELDELRAQVAAMM